MSTEAPAELEAIYAPIREEVRLLGDFLREEFASNEPFILRILDHISRFRGKQIRPALLFLSHRLCGGSVGPDLVKVGAVLEMIHTATLVHDDVLDDAGLRRNMETVHRRWGERAAVLIGDFIYSRGFQLATEVPGMAGILSETTHTICEGELLQIGHRFVPDLSEDTYFEIIRKKTAVLYATACRLGGVFTGLDSRTCARLHDFGNALGMAFQIVDDCLDYSGKEAVMGKSLGTDLHQGKLTLPLIYLRESLPASERAWLRDRLGEPFDASVERRIQEMVRERGVLPEAFGRAGGFLQRARASLAQVSVPRGDGSDVRENLEMVTDYVLKRQR